MDYQWYPGHMTKAIRQMKEDIKLIDIVIELVDARIPSSSRNPDIDSLAGNKSRLIILNKSDLADSVKTKEWMEHFKEKGFFVISIDSRKKNSIKEVEKIIEKACEKKRERDRKRGIKNRPIRAMVVGIPNVGKSTFINSYAGKAATKTGNKPGVTKGKQWIRLNKSVELLDTPGILWPKFEDRQVGFNLACIGSMNDNILDNSEIATGIIEFIINNYPSLVNNRYEVDEKNNLNDIITEIATKRNCIKKGQEIDYNKVYNLIIDEFRSGTIGRITLE
ncbi:MAG TPA: ribosome biogenesis GTPase YlqF [Lachnospiraceae bacterium]|nr:ribosome biogenesis GTPase YlqF [Lachnospiraceae bacterium]